MMKNETSLKIYKSLADRERIRIMSILCKSDSYVELLAEILNLTPATVCYHLKKLEGAGLVESRRLQHYVIYSANQIRQTPHKTFVYPNFFPLFYHISLYGKEH